MSHYKPINCDYHSIIESYATKKLIVEIIFYSEKIEKKVRSRIIDIYTTKGEEFLTLVNGENVRLDDIKSIDGIASPSCTCS